MNGLSFKELLKYKKDLNKKLSKTNGSDNINEINEKISLINEMLEEKKKYYSNQDIVKWGQNKKDALTKEEYLYASKMCEEIKDYKKLIEDEQREKIGVKKSKKGFFKKAAVIAGSLILAVGTYFGSYSIFHKKNKDVKDDNSVSQIEDQDNNYQNSNDRLMIDVGVSTSQIDELLDNEQSNSLEESITNSNLQSSQNNVSENNLETGSNTTTVIETVNDNVVDNNENNNSVIVKEEIIPEVIEENSEIITDPEDIVREGDEIPSEEIVHEETVIEKAPTVDEGNMQIEEDENDVTYYNNQNNSTFTNPSSNNKVEEETTFKPAPEIDYDNMEIEEDEDDITYYDEEGNEISLENSAYVLTLKM